MAAYGFAWHMWRRHRIALIGFGAYFVFLFVLVRVLPASEVRPENFGPGAFIPLTGLLFTLMAAFINPDADVAATNSSYPSWFFLLPVKTRNLAFWPFMIGAASLVFVWFATALGIMIPAGIHAPLWPAALLVAVLAILQALFWTPFPIPYLRPALAVILLPVAIVATINAFMQGVSPLAITVNCLSVALACHLISGAGLQVGRAGGFAASSRNPDSSAAPRTRPIPIPALKPFKSRLAAQTWLEWTRNGIALPVTTLCMFILFSLPMLWVRDLVPLMPSANPAGIGAIHANLALRGQMFIPFLVLFCAMMFGCGVRKSDQRRHDMSLLPFLTARPITSGQIVLAKMRMAALSALAAWVVVIIFGLICLMMPAQDGERSGSLGLLMISYLTPRFGVMILAAFALLLLITWRNQVDSLCFDLCGIRWLVTGISIAVSIFGLVLMIFVANMIGDPDLQRRTIARIPSVMRALAVIKLLCTVIVIPALVRKRVLSLPQLAYLSAAWIALLLLVTACLTSFASTPPVDALTGSFLLLPLVRIAAAPLALERNRHR